MKTNELGICPLCYGCGMEIVEGKGARPCECRRPAARKKLVENFPEKLRLKVGAEPHLSTVEPLTGLHKKPEFARKIFDAQARFIRRMREEPLRSAFLCGDNGSGKTHLAYAVALSSFDLGKTVIACTLSELLEDFRRYITCPSAELGLNIPRIDADRLCQKQKKYTLLVDEADKPAVSEFRCEQLFQVLNAAANYGHQIIATSNLNSRRFVAHWSKCDESYGNSIAKRFSEGAIGFEAFWL